MRAIGQSFLYTWSEFALAPTDWSRFGLAVQRTKVYQTEFDIQRGFFAGFSYQRADGGCLRLQPGREPDGGARRQRRFLNGVRDTGCPMTATIEGSEPTIVYWHRELPPLEAELVAEHTVEANSSRVPGRSRIETLWDVLRSDGQR